MADKPATTTKYRVKRQFTGSDGQSYTMGREYTSTDQKEIDKQLQAGNIEEAEAGGQGSQSGSGSQSGGQSAQPR